MALVAMQFTDEVNCEHEDFVPRQLAEAYVQAAARAGDPARLIVVPHVGHFEIASPRASPWPQVESAIRALLEESCLRRHGAREWPGRWVLTGRALTL